MTKNTKTTATAKKAATAAKKVVAPVVTENNATAVDAFAALSDRINKKLMHPIQVRHTTPVACILKLGKGGKHNEKAFGAYQTQSMQVQDVLSVANTTRLFTGDDGKGTNAPLYIEDADVRAYLGFDVLDESGSIEQKQTILDEDGIVNILNLTNKKAFETAIEEFQGNIAKMKLLADMIKKSGYNDAQRIKYIEKVLNIDINLNN